MANQDLKQMYRTRTEGDFPATVEVLGRAYEKVEDLRYGTNPHQPAAFYRPADGGRLVLGAYEMLKTGKSGLSQTNLEDMHHAVGILKYMPRAACAVMKHCNPSGVAMRQGDQPLAAVYQRARDADARRILGDELRREEDKLAALQREYNNGEPERLGSERNYARYQERVAGMRAAIQRKEADIAAIRRELGKLPP